jgi:hypothetical protein
MYARRIVIFYFCLSQWKICSSEKWEAGIWDQGQFGNKEEGERQPLEAATKQRLVKLEKTARML